ncbi:MAG: hypothetical protein MPW16_05195 [Candidatus Manganitrophus sp.]|nr:MAG: hypothetical protein MPW16_05195 [Candidatus Manganitrophus sp.]
MNICAKIVESQLISLGSFLHESEWYGRENELVNLFAHSFLSGNVKITQIGIEVAVKQLPRFGGKALVRKDLVVWNHPNETLWVRGTPANDPAVIIEFKVNAEKKCAPDLDWLCKYTKVYPHVVGFSVCGHIKHNRRVTFARVERGMIAAQQVAPADARSGRG